MGHDRKPTTWETKHEIKLHIYKLELSREAVMSLLNVSNRQIIFALREESKEQFLRVHYKKALETVKADIDYSYKTLLKDKINTMNVNLFIKRLELLKQQLAEAELGVYKEVLE